LWLMKMYVSKCWKECIARKDNFLKKIYFLEMLFSVLVLFVLCVCTIIQSTTIHGGSALFARAHAYPAMSSSILNITMQICAQHNIQKVTMYTHKITKREIQKLCTCASHVCARFILICQLVSSPEPEYIYAYLDSQNPIILHFTCIMFENSLSLGLPPAWRHGWKNSLFLRTRRKQFRLH
jgi:hypothetical protein